MTKALIVYASFTGNTDEAAHILEGAFRQLEIQAQIMECTQVDPADFLTYDICVVATYTWGRDGELPDEMFDFFDGLPDINLTGKVYGVLGTGDTLYDEFCKSVDDFDKQFKLTHATRGSDVVKIDSYPEEKDKQEIFKFAANLVNTYKELKHLKTVE